MLLLTLASPGHAQTIEPFYADTSSYEIPAFHVADRFRIVTEGCYSKFDVPPKVIGNAIRIAKQLVPRLGCGHADPYFDVVMDETIWLPASLPAGRYTVEFGYVLDEAFVPRAVITHHVDDGRNKCGRYPDLADVQVSMVSAEAADRIASVARNSALDPAL